MVVVCFDGVELVAVQDEGFACALRLNPEEIREEVGRVEVRGCGLFGFRNGLFPDMPCMKRVHRDKKASVHWLAARTKERFSSR